MNPLLPAYQVDKMELVNGGSTISALGSPLLRGSEYSVNEAGSGSIGLDLIRDSKSLSTSKSRFYATNQPKILLETITARTTVILLVLTYVCFIVCEVIDLRTIELGFSNNAAFDLASLPCPANFPEPSSVTFGCLQSDNTTWTGTVLSLSNVISVQLDVKRSNITVPIEHNQDNKTVTMISLQYNVDLWACYRSDGCGNSFSKDLSGLDSSQWHQVLTLSNQPLYIDTTNAVKDGFVQAPLINTTFQNQEAVPTNGIVKSYYVTVKYMDLPGPSKLIFDTPLVTQDLTYVMQIVNRPSPYASTIATIVLLVCTVLLTAVYIPIVLKYQNGQWLPEQAWIVIYLCALIAYQNPIYSAITLQESVAPGAAYASYVLDSVGQSTFLVIWLCFADAVHNKPGNKVVFYLPKVFFGLFFFAVSLVTLTYEFPDLSQWFGPSDRSPVEAVENWPESVLIVFCSFSLIFLLLFWVWAVWWFVTLYFARRSLSKLPYMNTRYLQLSYRFFVIQATLVTIYYVSQYGIVIYKISPGSWPGLTGMTNSINTLFRQQTQLFGKVLFLTVYAFSLGFLFLPASFLESPLASALRATYVVSEEELRGIVSKRKKTIQALNNVMLINNLVIKAKAEVFCVDRALDLRNVAFEVYYSPQGRDTEGAEGIMDLGSHGYELVDCHFLKEKSIFVLIARHKVSRRLVIAFRGSLNYKHFTTNIDYGKKDVDILSLSMDKLDAIDELEVEHKAVEFERTLHAGLRKATNNADLQTWEEGADEDGEDEEGEDASFSRQSSINNAAFSRQPSFNQSEMSGGNVPPSTLRRTRTVRTTISDGMALGGASIKQVAGVIGGATVQILEGSTGLVRSAAKYTPVLQGLVKPYIHSGFWDAYSLVREFVHTVVRRELAEEPADLFVTGHSLGGALGTIASLDLAVHTLPRINAFLAKKRRLAAEEAERSTLSYSQSTTAGGTKRFRRVKLCCYNFGTPKVGNGSFAALVNKWVPDSFRVVVDGDVVSSLPPTGYRHSGTEIVVDRAGNGSIIIDRSFVERWLRPATVYSIRVHSLHTYLKGLHGIKKAADFFSAYQGDSTTTNDFLYLAFRKAQQVKSKSSFSSDGRPGRFTNQQPSDFIPPPLSVNTSDLCPGSTGSDGQFYSAKSRLDSQSSTPTPTPTPPLSPRSPQDGVWRTIGVSPYSPNPIFAAAAGSGSMTEQYQPQHQQMQEQEGDQREEESTNDDDDDEEDDEGSSIRAAHGRSFRGIANRFLGALGMSPLLDTRSLAEEMARADPYHSMKEKTRRKKRGT